jgi:hypothetical protein
VLDTPLVVPDRFWWDVQDDYAAGGTVTVHLLAVLTVARGRP